MASPLTMEVLRPTPAGAHNCIVTTQDSKNIRLEAARGIAAFIVFIGHFIAAFMPALVGQAPPSHDGESFVGSVYFVLFNGQAAVMFFFVLSGYVLSVGALRAKNTRPLLLGGIRRWPRLIPVALISILFSFFLYKSDLYFYSQARELTHSEWHSNWNLSYFSPSLLMALKQGAFDVFFSKENYLNTNLWTMPREILGSYFIFIITALQIKTENTKFWLLFFIAAIAIGISKQFIPFFSGFLIALLLCKRSLILSPLRTTSIALTGVFLLSYSKPTGDFSWALNLTLMPIISENYLRVLIQTLGSTLLLITLLAYPKKTWLDGRFGRIIGELSFPFYALHTIIILSFSSFIYIKGNISIQENFIITLALILALSWPLSRLDIRWTALLKIKTSNLFK